MNILITNVHSARNAGDSVLLEATLAELRAVFPGATITIAMNDPKSYRPRHDERVVAAFMDWFKATSAGTGAWRLGRVLLAPWLLGQSLVVALTQRWWGRPAALPRSGARRELLLAYCQADLVVSCPGNFFLSGSGIGIPLLLAILALAYGWLAGKPLYMMQQTIGPLRRRRDQLAVRWVLERVRIVLLRDEVSRATLTEIGLEHPSCHVLPDLAFLYQGGGDVRPFAATLAPRNERPFLGMTVINFGAHNRFFRHQARYEAAVAAAICTFLRRHGGTVFLFPQVHGPTYAEDDRPPARRVAALAGDLAANVVVIEDEWPASPLQAAYGQMDLFLGTRLHSNIFALTAGTPVLPIAYQYKTHGVMQTLGLDHWVLDIDSVDAQQLTERLEQLWQQRAELRAYLATTIPAIQQQARLAAQWIRRDFELVRGP
ncbi:MAG: polysaccharide pyruvyl transferase family protein [Caldilineaceae bacterium]|nr:polysaccharide pyruvyl transferase family protein [Caldilineaceae bacterium]